MDKKTLAEAVNFGLKTTDLNASDQKAFSSMNHNTLLDQITSIVKSKVRPGNVHRLYRCFSCKRCFAASRMSTALVVCRACSELMQTKGKIAKRNEIDRIMHGIRCYLRARLEVK